MANGLMGVSISLPRELVAQVDAAASRERRNRSRQIEVLLQKALADEERKDTTKK